DPCRAFAQALPELLQEPRLPDAGLAHDHEHLSCTRASLLEALDEEQKLTLPSDEARAAGRALGEADQAIGALRGVIRIQQLQVEVATESSGGTGADDDVAGFSTGEQRMER